MYVSAQLYNKVRMGGVYRKDRFCEILRIAAPAVRMREKDAGNPLLAVEERPGKFPIMIIKETGRQAYAPSRCHICQRRLMIMTREEIHAHLLDHPLLHTAKRRRRAAAHHQSAAAKILRTDDILPCKRVVLLRDEIDPAVKERIGMHIRDTLRISCHGKDQILLALQE